MSDPSGPTVAAVLTDLFRRPGRHLVARWNWKAALLSGMLRGALFFVASLRAGLDAAVAALVVEFAYRAATTGFFASLTQAFRRATPAWAAGLVVALGIPVLAHVLEYVAHGLHGTVELDRAMAASVTFTVFSATFTLFAMRRGVFIVGDDDRQPLRRDMAAMPGLVLSFTAALSRGLWGLVTRSRSKARRAAHDEDRPSHQLVPSPLGHLLSEADRGSEPEPTPAPADRPRRTGTGPRMSGRSD